MPKTKYVVVPVRQRKKGRTKVWVDCEAAQAQAYDIRDRSGKLLRREASAAEAARVVDLFSRPPRAPVVDRAALAGSRWSDVASRVSGKR
jgi:hypothetical protein